MYGSAAALITSASGDVLLVKPNYRDHWSLPGGIIEDGEPPHVACAREVQEELGLSVSVGPLVAVDWLAPEGTRSRPAVAFLFDGGVLTDPSAIVLQESELDEWRFIPPADVAAFLPPRGALRVTAGLRANASGAEYRAAYVPALASAPRSSGNSSCRLGQASLDAEELRSSDACPCS